MNQVLEFHLAEAWLKLNKPNQPCIMFRYWEDHEEGETSIRYFQRIFTRAKIDVHFPRDTSSEYIVADVDASLVYKIVQEVHGYDKWGENLYGWDGTAFYWSRD